jgi:polysaccharide export outer membrane protein
MQLRVLFVFVLSAGFSLAALVASAQDAAAGKSGLTAKSASVASSAPGLAPPEATSQFLLGPADVLRINVWKSLELSQTVTVGPDGFVSLPLLGDVHVAGMTANQLGQILTKQLGSYIVSPQVTVSVIEIRSRQVYVLGQVNKPGGYPLIGPVTVLQLIAEAGGLNTYANRKAIVILRPPKDNKDGMEKINFNYNSVIHGNSKQNIQLQPGDTVVVP